MIQNLIIKVDSVTTLEKYLRLTLNTIFSFRRRELAVKIVDYKAEHLNLHIPPTVDLKEHFPVIFISGGPLPKKEKAYFDGYGSWKTFRSDELTNEIDFTVIHVTNIIKKNEKNWKVKFQEKFGNGYNDEFNYFDGSINPGYELRTCQCSPEWLSISIVHIYYGK